LVALLVGRKNQGSEMRNDSYFARKWIDFKWWWYYNFTEEGKFVNQFIKDELDRQEKVRRAHKIVMKRYAKAFEMLAGNDTQNDEYQTNIFAGT
jgi:hypothetical protein